MIKKIEIEKAQNSWGNGIITIGKLKDNPKESRIFTVNFINKHYDFGDFLLSQQKLLKNNLEITINQHFHILLDQTMIMPRTKGLH